MKVYIVTQGEYSDYHIEAVFTDKEQAKLYCAVHKPTYDPCEISEWEADEVQLETRAKVMEKWVGRFDFQGKFDSVWKNGYALEQPIQVNRMAWARGFTVIVCLPEGASEEKAKKVVCDIFAAWEYGQMEGKP